MGDTKKFDSFNVHMMAKATATSHVFFSNSPLKYLDNTNTTMTSTVVTTGAMTTLTTSTTDAHTTPNFEPFANTTFHEEPFCLQVLYKDIKERLGSAKFYILLFSIFKCHLNCSILFHKNLLDILLQNSVTLVIVVAVIK